MKNSKRKQLLLIAALAIIVVLFVVYRVSIRPPASEEGHTQRATARGAPTRMANFAKTAPISKIGAHFYSIPERS